MVRNGWSEEPRTDSVASFGHVVHARDESSEPAPTASDRKPLRSAPASTQLLATKFDPSRPRAFVPVLPPLSSLNFLHNLQAEGLWHSTIKIRFIPSAYQQQASSQDQVDVSKAPPIELRLEAGTEEILRIVDLRAVTSTHTTDLLYPDQLADIRLNQYTYFTLPGESLHLHAEPILDFLNKSDLRPWDGKLNTPGRVTGVKIPKRFLPADAFGGAFTAIPEPPVIAEHEQTAESATSEAMAQPSVEASENDAQNSAAGETSTALEPEPVKEPVGEDSVEVTYLLAAIELHRVVSTEFEGFRLNYRSVEAGQRGGKQTGIELEAVAVPDPATLPLPSASENIISRAKQLAWEEQALKEQQEREKQEQDKQLAKDEETAEDVQEVKKTEVSKEERQSSFVFSSDVESGGFTDADLDMAAKELDKPVEMSQELLDLIGEGTEEELVEQEEEAVVEEEVVDEEALEEVEEDDFDDERLPTYADIFSSGGNYAEEGQTAAAKDATAATGDETAAPAQEESELAPDSETDAISDIQAAAEEETTSSERSRDAAAFLEIAASIATGTGTLQWQRKMMKRTRIQV